MFRITLSVSELIGIIFIGIVILGIGALIIWGKILDIIYKIKNKEKDKHDNQNWNKELSVA